MKQYHTDSTDSDKDPGLNGEPLSDYVKRMETEENLKKLARKLEGDLKNPHREQPDVSTPDVSTPDVSTPDCLLRSLKRNLNSATVSSRTSRPTSIAVFS